MRLDVFIRGMTGGVLHIKCEEVPLQEGIIKCTGARERRGPVEVDFPTHLDAMDHTVECVNSEVSGIVDDTVTRLERLLSEQNERLEQILSLLRTLDTDGHTSRSGGPVFQSLRSLASHVRAERATVRHVKQMLVDRFTNAQKRIDTLQNSTRTWKAAAQQFVAQMVYTARDSASDPYATPTKVLLGETYS